MAVRTSHYRCAFHADGADLPLWLTPAGPITLEPGLKPNVWTFAMAGPERAKIGDDVAREGRLLLWDRSPTTGPADVSIRSKIVDFLPAEQAQKAAGGPMTVAAWRVSISDHRFRFVEPRGGRLTVGVVNPKQANKDDPDAAANADAVTMNLREMVNACLVAMGLPADAPARLEGYAAPRDAKWLGSHAPTELEKLLKIGQLRVIPTLDGKIELWQLGDGPEPTLPADDKIPEVDVPRVDLRGKQVVIASYPTRVVHTEELAGPAPADPGKTWQFVAQDTDDQWKPVNSLDLNAGVEFADHVRTRFYRIAEARRERLRKQAYRVLRVPAGGERPPANVSPVLAFVVDQAGDNAGPPSVRAKIAQANPLNGVPEISGDRVACSAVNVIGDNLIELDRRVGRVDRALIDPELPLANSIDDVAEVALAISAGESKFIPLPRDEGLLTWSYEGAAKDEKGKWKPTYFEIGFKEKDGGGELLKLSDAELQAAIAGAGDTWVVCRPELQLRVYLGEEQNRPDLVAKAEKIAEDLVRVAGQRAKSIRARGWHTVKLNGLTARVVWDYAALTTTVETGGWWAADLIDDAEDYRKRREEAYPEQAATEAGRKAMGAAGERPPVIATGTPIPPPPPLFEAGLELVKVVKDGGEDGTRETAATWTYTIKDRDSNKVLATGLTPFAPRPNGMRRFGTEWGLAIKLGNAWTLLDAWEVEETGPCEPEDEEEEEA